MILIWYIEENTGLKIERILIALFSYLLTLWPTDFFFLVNFLICRMEKSWINWMSFISLKFLYYTSRNLKVIVGLVFSEIKFRAEEMALQKCLSLGLSTPVGQLCDSSFRLSDILLWLLWALHACCALTYMQAKHPHKIIFFKKVKCWVRNTRIGAIFGLCCFWN